jgi:hypothetical protein
MGAGSKTFARRHNVFGKQVLGTRTEEGGTSVTHVDLSGVNPPSPGANSPSKWLRRIRGVPP